MKIKSFLIVSVLLLALCNPSVSFGDEADNYFIRGDQGIIYLEGNITWEKAKWTSRAIMEFSTNPQFKNLKGIEIIIDSHGGRMDGALKICNAMRKAKQKMIVRTIVIGDAQSGAALILAAGTKGERYVGRYSMIMIHGPASDFSNIRLNTAGLDELRGYFESTDRSYYLCLADFTGKTAKEVKRDCYKEKYMTAVEALKYGLADKMWN